MIISTFRSEVLAIGMAESLMSCLAIVLLIKCAVLLLDTGAGEQYAAYENTGCSTCCGKQAWLYSYGSTTLMVLGSVAEPVLQVLIIIFSPSVECLPGLHFLFVAGICVLFAYVANAFAYVPTGESPGELAEIERLKARQPVVQRYTCCGSYASLFMYAVPTLFTLTLTLVVVQGLSSIVTQSQSLFELLVLNTPLNKIIQPVLFATIVYDAIIEPLT